MHENIRKKSEIKAKIFRRKYFSSTVIFLFHVKLFHAPTYKHNRAWATIKTVHFSISPSIEGVAQMMKILRSCSLAVVDLLRFFFHISQYWIVYWIKHGSKLLVGKNIPIVEVQPSYKPAKERKILLCVRKDFLQSPIEKENNQV